jgi:IclR family acetate operon transcriptional repressor
MRSEHPETASLAGRIVALLDSFEPEDRDITLTELTRRTKLPKATTYRLATQLVEHDLLEKTHGGYRLGLRLFELGSIVYRHRRLREAALPFMEDLHEATRWTVQLGVLDHGEVLYIEKIRGKVNSARDTHAGARRPLHCTGLGKAILAHSPPEVVRAVLEAGLPRFTRYTIVAPGLLLKELETVVQTGVAYDREESLIGNTCVAAPVLDRDGKAKVSMSLAGATEQFDPERSAFAVRTAALGLSRALHGAPWLPLSRHRCDESSSFQEALQVLKCKIVHRRPCRSGGASDMRYDDDVVHGQKVFRYRRLPGEYVQARPCESTLREETDER